MTINADVLNAGLTELKGPLEHTFKKRNKFYEYQYKGGKVRKGTGQSFSRDFAGKAPATGTGIFAGSELLNLSRRDVVRQLQLGMHRIVVLVSVPIKMIQQMTGPMAPIDLQKDYVALTKTGIERDMNKFLLTGQSAGKVFATAELAGFTTLNGQFTSGRGLGAANGMLEFAAPASQNLAVHGFSHDNSQGYFNQYQTITSFQSHGRRRMRRLLRDCGDWTDGSKMPTMIVLDADTFDNFEDDLEGHVRVKNVTDERFQKDLFVIPWKGAEVCYDSDLDRTLFTGDAADGIGYYLQPDAFESAVWQDFKVSEWRELDDQDVVFLKMDFSANSMLRRPAACGVLTGGARA